MIAVAGRQSEVRRWQEVYRPAVRLGEPGSDGFHRSWIMLMPEGTFRHPEYGRLAFTRRKLQEFKRHFDAKVRKIDIALDRDHDAKAATGWLEQVEYRAARGPDTRRAMGTHPLDEPGRAAAQRADLSLLLAGIRLISRRGKRAHMGERADRRRADEPAIPQSDAGGGAARAREARKRKRAHSPVPTRGLRSAQRLLPAGRRPRF